ncbi:MAG: adenosylcobinamide-GDP ribazoletransferase [Nitrospirae bacterium]|nr:adenosylcobinamide-GDP ribazoletransferase [Nitrospirota bacterium]MBI3352746.1 adenosylcobinamide-GDP ribazoletransferase [Nitrospirota bacterium]
MIHQFAAAWNFLTIIPFPFAGKETVSAEDLGRSLTAFPWVGLALGLMAGAAYLGLSQALPQALVALSVIFLLTIATRGLHMDGLADTLDGLQGRTREISLKIMKESTIGTFGALGLIFALGFKVSALFSLPPREAIKALWMMPLLGRWVFVTLLVYFPYARPEGGLGSAFVSHAKPSNWIWATLFTGVAAILIASWWGAVLAGITLSLTWMAGRYFKSRLGGVTGDTVGGTGEVVETVTLILWNVYERFFNN